ncbi:MAG: sigma-70 family RNA polymerase sigma factor [Acidobacteriota bacterium]|nr:sigma-70 family RNA polymerase sigma factor [Acidobacteriota bacterium]
MLFGGFVRACHDMRIEGVNRAVITTSFVCYERKPLYNRCTVQRHTFDADYVRRLAACDDETERHFTAYFGDLLSAKLRSRLRSPHLIEDVKQETFLRVLKTIRLKHGLDEPSALGSYVNSVCNNVLFEVYRAQSKTSDPIEDCGSDEASAETTMVDRQERAEVREVLSGMPEKDGTILRWLFFEERDKDEVCRQLSVDREYLRVLVHRAKLRFRSDFLKRQLPRTSAADRVPKFNVNQRGGR